MSLSRHSFNQSTRLTVHHIAFYPDPRLIRNVTKKKKKKVQKFPTLYNHQRSSNFKLHASRR